MFRSLSLSTAILIAGATVASEAFGEADLHSANAVVSGCRFYDGPTTSQNPRFDPFGQGYCIGLLEGLDYEGLRCRPREVTLGQVVRVVLKYVDNRPERMHEDFRVLAIEAMKAAWPCR
jgi:Rap1a immunity proteins